MTTKYVIHCDACGSNTVVGDTNVKMVEIKVAPIPGGIPTYNEELKKTETRKPLPRPKMFKCPKCGRGATARAYTVAESKHEEEKKNEKETRTHGRETGAS